MYNPTYLGEIELSEETLAHYGVKGMRWGRRIRSALRNNPIARRRRHNRYVASHLADDVASGRTRIGITSVMRTNQYGQTRESTGVSENPNARRRVIATQNKPNGRKLSVTTMESHTAPNGYRVSYGRTNTTTTKDYREAKAAIEERKRSKKQSKAKR